MEPTRKHREMAVRSMFPDVADGSFLDAWVQTGAGHADGSPYEGACQRVAAAFATLEAELRAELAVPAGESLAAWAVRCLDAWHEKRGLPPYRTEEHDGCWLAHSPEAPLDLDGKGATPDAARIAAARALAAEDASLPQPPEVT